jgi:hypothetical protein
MSWSIWRQHRAEALTAATLVVIAVVLVRIVFFQSAGATPVSRTDWLVPMQALLVALPGLAGVFIGAPLLARDLEQGTHRLLWTQGVTRGRWLRAKLALVIATVAVAAVLLAALTSWAADTRTSAIDAAGRISVWIWFDQQGPAFAAYVVFALALGTAAGAVVGRTYPAMSLTLLVFVVSRAVVNVFLRPYYLPPLQVPIQTFFPRLLPGGGPYESLFVGTRYQTLAGQPLTADQTASMLGQSGRGDLAAVPLAPHGVAGWILYQPGDRFWTFQGIEAGIFLALAVLLVGLTVYWVTRRLS